jgi:hypothetical protein
MIIQAVTRWRSALQVKSFRGKIIISCILLVGCAFIAPLVFQFIQQRTGFTLNDYILNWLPVYDLSLWTFVLLYFLILLGVVALLGTPQQFLVTLQAYIILTILRFITMLLVPLDPPLQIIELQDPFVQRFFYQQMVTKDLFFSGHTSLLVLLALSVPVVLIKRILFFGALMVGLMLLLQHAHYTIDVLLAPLFSWLAITLANKIP